MKSKISSSIILLLLIVWSYTSSQPLAPLSYSVGINEAMTSSGKYFQQYKETNDITLHPVGKTESGTIYRAFFQWSLPANLVPAGSVITQATLQFSWQIDLGPYGQPFNIYVINQDINSDSGHNLYDSVTGSAADTKSLPTSGQFSQSYSAGSAFVNGILNQLSNNRFTIGLQNYYEGTNSLWEFEAYNVQLTITIAPDTVVANQVFSTGGTIQNSSVAHWENTAFVNYGVPHTFTFNVQSTQTFRGDNRDLWFNSVTGALEKYQIWSGQPDVVNHRDFFISPSLKTMTSQFNVTNNATLQSQAVDGGNATGSADFMDPWLVDNPDPNHGDSLRNEGMSAPFKTVSYVTNNLGTSSSYHGVFLNQQIVSGQTYYSVNMTPRPINGYLAFFSGWACSPSGSVTFTNASTTPTSVVFNSSGATITANSTYYTVTKNATVPAGTYTMAGSLTVNSGVTLTLNSNTTLNFPSGASLVVNGALVANGATFNFTQTYYPYSGITINSNGSSLVNCTISGADQPLSFSNVNTATVNSCIINNSVFSSSQAINVSNSVPNIVSVQINGQSGSSNGVRYTNGRGGTLQNATIQNCSAGNGIVIQGNSNPSISDCAITSNYYYGIIVTSNGAGIPLISGNNITGNGTHGSTRQYHNIVFLSSSQGTIQSNQMSGSLAGIGVYSGSFPTAGNEQNGLNNITGNNYGLMCSDNGSALSFGSYSGRYYSGTCNNIYGNTYADAYAGGGGSITATYNWWGVYPPSASQFVIGSGSTINYSNALTSQGGCPSGGGGDVIVREGSSLTTGVDSSGSASELYQRATDALFNKDYSTSSILCRSILRRNTSIADKQRAMVRLLSVFLQSGDTTILSDLKSYMVGSDSLSQTAEEQLANAYAASGNTSKAVSLANDLIAKNPGTEIEKRALLLLASLRAYDKSAESISAQALRDVKSKFGSSLDQGLMAALTTASDVQAVSFSSNKEAAQKAKGEAKVDNANTVVTEYGIENYPNPFNPTTTIAYQLPKDGRVTIKIFDAIGREVTTLVDEFKPSGRYSVQFDASHLSSGIYFYSLRSGDYNTVKKMSLIK